MALSIDIVPGTNQFQAAVIAAADALHEIDKTEKSINAVAVKLGVNYQQAATALGNAEAKAEALRKAEKAAHNEQSKAQKQALNDERKEQKERKKTAIDGLAIGAAITAAVAASVALAGALALSAKKAADTRKETQALIESYSGGNGPAVLRSLDSLAGKLGESVDETRKKFIEFRQAGNNNEMSAKLIKLRADLKATGLSAEAADKEIGYVLSAQGDAAKLAMIQTIGKAYGGIGDGALAAQKATQSLDGAMNRLDNVVTGELVKLWERVSPAIGKAVNEITDFVVEFIKSDTGQGIIKGIGDAFIWLASKIGPAMKMLADNKELIGTVLVVGFAALAAAIGSVVVPLVIAEAATIGFIAAAAAIGAAVAAAAVGVYKGVQAIVEHWSEIKAIAESAYDWGANIVNGLIDGVTSRIGAAVETVREFASGIAGSFTKALGIQSPSKLFAEYGRNTVEGYEAGERSALPSTMPLQEAAENAVPKPPAPDSPGIPVRQAIGATTTSGDGSTGGDTSKTVAPVFNINVSGGGDSDTVARAIRQEIHMLLSAGALSRGMA